jgi:hypothetical protein
MNIGNCCLGAIGAVKKPSKVCSQAGKTLATVCRKKKTSSPLMAQGKIKVKNIIIHWAEGDTSKYDKFPKTYKTFSAAHKAIIPVYRSLMDEIKKYGGGGYNKVKFTVNYQNGEQYEGRLDVSPKEDNPTTNTNIIGKHMKEVLNYYAGKNDKEAIDFLKNYSLND